MRIVMMGTGPFAVPTFRALHGSPHEVPALITRPSAPTRGRSKIPPNPMRSAAEELGIPVLDPPSINRPDATEALKTFQADLFVVCDYGQILSADTLRLARLGGVNLHGSLLPKYRGAAPIHWALYHGEKETGVTVIHMTPKLDAGPMLVRSTLPIGPDEDAVQLEEKLSGLGVQATIDAIDLLSSWDGHCEIGTLQDMGEATQAPRLTKKHGAVDWSRSAEQICDQVRAFKPWPGTYSFWKDASGKSHRLILDRVHHASDISIDGTSPGQVIDHPASPLLLTTGDGILAIDSVQPAGKRVMSAEEYLNGHPIPAETVFGTLAFIDNIRAE